MPVAYIIALNVLGFFPIAAARMALSLHGLSLGADSLEVGLLAAVNQLGTLLLSIAVGAFADRRGSYGLYILCFLSCAGGLILPYWVPSIASLFVASALIGLSAVLMLVLTQSLVGLLSKPDAVTRNYTNMSVFGALSVFGAPLVIGYSIDTFGPELAWLSLLPFPIAGLALIALFGRHLPRGREGGAHKGAGGSLFSLPGLWWVIMLSGAAQLCSDLFPFYMPLYGHALGLSAAAIGVITASGAVSMFAARLVQNQLLARFGEERVLAWSFGVCALAFALVPAFSSVWALVLVSLLFGAGSSVGHPVTASLMYRASPPGRAAEAIGVRATANGLLRVIAPGAFGALGALAGLGAVFLATGAMIGAVAAAGGLRLRRRAGKP